MNLVATPNSLKSDLPVASVPSEASMERLKQNGERVLIASNGTFIEVKRPWGYFIRRLGMFQEYVSLPFRELHETTEYYFESLPLNLLKEFNEYAIRNKNKKVQAVIFWNDVTKAFRLALSDVSQYSDDHQKPRPLPMPGEHELIVCQSYGRRDAIFHQHEKLINAKGVYFFYIVGSCHKDTVSATARLCINGAYSQIPLDF